MENGYFGLIVSPHFSRWVIYQLESKKYICTYKNLNNIVGMYGVKILR